MMIHKVWSSKILVLALSSAGIGLLFSQNTADIPPVEGAPVEGETPREFSTFFRGNVNGWNKWFEGLERLGMKIRVVSCSFRSSYEENQHIVRVALRRLLDGQAVARLTRAVQGRDAYERLIDDIARRGAKAETICLRPEMPAASLIAVVQYPIEAAP